jgi:hypothetical protein
MFKGSRAQLWSASRSLLEVRGKRDAPSDVASGVTVNDNTTSQSMRKQIGQKSPTGEDHCVGSRRRRRISNSSQELLWNSARLALLEPVDRAVGLVAMLEAMVSRRQEHAVLRSGLSLPERNAFPQTSDRILELTEPVSFAIE